MRIVACVRPVRELSQSLPEVVRNRLAVEEGRRVLGQSDLCALEEALRIRERLGGGCEVVALSAGPEPFDAPLRSCLAMGADGAIRVSAVGDGWDPLEVAAALAGALRQLGADLILCGERSGEGMHGVVGAAVARFLGWPVLMGIVRLELLSGGTAIRATQRLERGDRWLWECPLPAVCTVDKSINVPRYVPVHRRIRAGRKTVSRLDLADATTLGEEIARRYGRLELLKLAQPRVRPKKTEAPPASLSPAERLKAIRSGGREKKEGKRLRGDPVTVSQEIVEFLAEKGFLT